MNLSEETLKKITSGRKDQLRKLRDKVEMIGETLKGALTKFQELNVRALKDSINPHFKSKYSDLTSVINAVNHGAEFGLSFSQSVEYKNILLEKSQEKDSTTTKIQEIYRDIFVTTTVRHLIDKDTLTCIVPVLINANDKDNPQKMGSAITYAKRYGLQSLYGLASDDDGNLASEKSQAKKGAGEDFNIK
jgi:hypothetical protein|tara:strand:- start:84 stop:653 length:570 start_codon:yes stop_codon:yes gene_type:complete